MTNHTLHSKSNLSGAKRNRILAAVAEEVVISDDDSHVEDGLNICNIIENHQRNGSSQTENSGALHVLGETIRNTLLEINEIREKNRERRHRELLQILKKLVQQESTANGEGNDSIANINTEVLNHDKHSQTCEYDAEQDFMKTYLSNADEVASSSSSTDFRNRSDKSDIGCTSTFTPSSSPDIKLLRTSEQNNEHTKKIKKTIAVSRDDTKTEFQKMRAKMMELQRQKMEDRERKKLKFIQKQNF